MNENSTEKSSSPKGFLPWLDNFWYHYKWHSIVCLFLIFALTVCSVQMCQKESFDVYVLYAGSYEVERQSSTADMPEYQKTKSSLSRVCDDFNDDGKVSLSFKDLFILSEEEIKEHQNKNDGTEINYTLLSQNMEILRDTMVYSSYYLCFVSPSVYEGYKAFQNVNMFASLSQYVNEGVEVSYYADDAVYLASTGFYNLPGFSEFPSDTLVCLRNLSDYTLSMNKKSAKAHFGAAEDVLEKILNYKK
jgi:hypothetical protein